MAAGEAHFAEATDAPTRRAVLTAKRLGFGVSIHAGEDPNSGGTAANVRCAIESYGASRIGHGYALLQVGVRVRVRVRVGVRVGVS